MRAIRAVRSERGSSLQADGNSGYEAKHRAYLQVLQARNQSYRDQQRSVRAQHADRERRETGFSLCFSGANAQKTPCGPPPVPEIGGKRRCRSSSGLHWEGDRAKNGQGTASGYSSQARGWRQWEERTVQIRGHDGAIFAIKPTGERSTVANPQSGCETTLLGTASCSEAAGGESAGSQTLSGSPTRQQPRSSAGSSGGSAASQVPEKLETEGEDGDFQVECHSEPGSDSGDVESVPEEVDDALRATMSATQQELRDLRQHLLDAGLADDADHVPPVPEEEALVAEGLGDVSTVRIASLAGTLAPEVATGTLGLPPEVATSASLQATVGPQADEPASSSTSTPRANHASPCAPLATTAATAAAAVAADAAMSSAVAEEQARLEALSPRAQMAQLVSSHAVQGADRAPTPRALDLAERITRLPAAWRGALIRLLEVAEEGGEAP